MSEQQDEQSGLILWLSQQSLVIRLVSFIVFVILIVGVIVGITGGLYYANVVNFPRLDPTAVISNVNVAEFAVFEDDEAYPAAVASAPDGTLYTGSYANGAVWRVGSDGVPVEIPQTRGLIGSVIGIDVGDDGTVYVLDHIDPFHIDGGGFIWTIQGDTVEQRAQFRNRGDIQMGKPNDLVVASDGAIYALDIVLGQILKVDSEGIGIWWTAPETTYQIAGLAYDRSQDALLVSDANRHAIYRLPIIDGQAGALETIFTLMESLQSAPAFNGLTVDATGTIYVAALEANEIWRVDSSDQFTVVAGNYRGSSDVAYDAIHNRLYVNNWDQSWLIPITLVVIQVDVPPRLPFSVDVINLE